MIPPFGYCSGSESGASALRRYQERKLRLLSFWRDGIERQLAAMNAAISALRRYQERKLRLLSFWRDGIERQLAAMNAAISTLEQQMHRDQADHQG